MIMISKIKKFLSNRKSGVINKSIPYYNSRKNMWYCEFPERNIKEEFGTLEYVVSEFIGDGLVYHYYLNGEVDHEHNFEGVLYHVLHSYDTFSIKGFEKEYSAQEIRIIEKLKEKIKEKVGHERD